MIARIEHRLYTISSDRGDPGDRGDHMETRLKAEGGFVVVCLGFKYQQSAGFA